MKRNSLTKKISYCSFSHQWVLDMKVGCIGTLVFFPTKPTRIQCRNVIKFCKHGVFGETFAAFLARKK